MWKFEPNGHSGTFEPSGKKQALPENTPTSSRRISASNTPGDVSPSGMSDHALASGVRPFSVSSIISSRRMAACPRFVRRAALPRLAPSTTSFTCTTSPRHLRRKDPGSGL